MIEGAILHQYSLSVIGMQSPLMDHDWALQYRNITLHCGVHIDVPPSSVKNISVSVISPLPLLVNPATDMTCGMYGSIKIIISKFMISLTHLT